MTAPISLQSIKKKYHGTLISYLLGFLLSLFLTLVSFILVVTEAFPRQLLIYIIIALAITQAIIQFIYFFHIGQETKPRWEMWMFFSMLLILLIISLGTLWVMHDLNSRVMPHMEMSHD